MARQDDWLNYAEEELIDSWQLLMQQPDRDRGWLKSGSRSSMPAPIHDQWFGLLDMDLALELGLTMADPSRPPRRQMGQVEMAKIKKFWEGPNCMVMAAIDYIDGEQAKRERARLFTMVVSMKAGRQPGGEDYSDIGKRLYGKVWGTARCDATTDTLRSRFDTCLHRVADRLLLVEVLSAGAR